MRVYPKLEPGNITAGQKIANQFIIADFAPYFAKVAPTAGDRSDHTLPHG